MVSSWNEVSVGMFSEIRAAYNDINMSEEDRAIGLVALLTGEDPLTMELSDFRQILMNLSFVNEEVKPAEVKKVYILNGKNYTLQKAINHVSTAQYIDFNNYIKEGEIDEKYADIISVFLIPEGMKYNDGYDIEEVKADINKHMSITDALGIFSYFFHFFVRFVQISQEYTSRRLKKMKSLTREERQKIEEITNQIQQISDSLASSWPFAKKRLRQSNKYTDSQ